jgi:hypothetical protein
LSVGIGLLKSGSSPASNIFAFLLFLARALTARLGIRSVTKGHEYYRRAVYKKTLLATMLGLHHSLDDPRCYSEMLRLGVKTDYSGATVAIATTVGQSEIEEILQRPEEWINGPLRPGTIVQAAVAVLRLLLVANILASTLVIFLLMRELFLRGISAL